MEFEEMKTIWDTQNREPLYVINEQALHNRILSKKRTVSHIANISELLCIIAMGGTGCLALVVNLFKKQNQSIAMYVLAAWMLGCGFYCLISRVRRIKGNGRFDRSMRGDLQHALAVASYQVRFSQLMRWNIVPIGILTLIAVWDSEKSGWIALGIGCFFALTYYAGGWEHNIYKNKKRELEILQHKLTNEKQP